MDKIFTIVKKELKRFFTDKRMLMTLFLPGILIYVIYALMGNFMNDAMNVSKDYVYNVIAVEVPSSMNDIFEDENYKIKFADIINDTDKINEKLKNKEIDLYIRFEEDFINKKDNNLQPKVDILYNSSSKESSAIYSFVSQQLAKTAINITTNYQVLPIDVATQEDTSKVIVTMLMPYLLLIFLFTGCLAISTESIAGEKERGTISTILVTPTKRSYIALGKIIALSLTSLASSFASFIGLILSLPKLMNGSGSDITISMYSSKDYLGLFFIILVTVLLFTTILSIVSTFAKNVKEASQWSSFLMVIVMLFGVSSLMGADKISTNPFAYLIPIYNSVQCMSSIFAMQFNGVNFLLTIISNAVFVGIGVFILAKMFNSEKIMSSN